MNKLITSMVIGILLGIIIPLAPLLFSSMQNKSPYKFEAPKNISTSITSATVTPEITSILSTATHVRTTNLLNILLIVTISLILSSIVSFYSKKSLEISRKKNYSE